MEIPAVARAAVYDAPNQPFQVREFPLRRVDSGEALVRVTMSTICRSDIHSYHGHRPNPTPCILGHEIIGTLVELGDQVSRDLNGDELAVGDRITWTEFFDEGDDYYVDVLDMPQKARGVRKYGHDCAAADPHFTGGFAEYCYLLPGTGILKLPPELTDEEATPLNCAVATMMAVTEAAAIEAGDTVVIQGLGLLGLYGCAIASARGARRVIAIDGVADRLALAARFGATDSLDISSMSNADIIDRVRTLCPPDGTDVVIEVCGVPSVVPDGLAMLRVGGRYVLAGLVNPNAEVTLDANVLVKKWVTLKGIHNYHPRHLPQALEFVLENRQRFPFHSIVDARFSLDQLDEAFERAAQRTVLRAAIVP